MANNLTDAQKAALAELNELSREKNKISLEELEREREKIKMYEAKNRSLTDTMTLMTRGIEISKNEIRVIEQQLAVLEDLFVAEGGIVGVLKDKENAAREQIDLNIKLTDELQKLTKGTKEYEEKYAALVKTQELGVELAEEIFAIEKIKEANLEKMIDLLKEDLEVKEALIEVEEQRVDNLIQVESRTQDLISSTTGINESWKQGFVGQLAQAHSLGQLNTALATSYETTKRTITPANVFGTLMEKVAQNTMAVAFAQDNARASMMQSTGAGIEYAKVIRDVDMANNSFGVSAADAGSAVEALYRHYTEFDYVSGAAKEELASTVALMDRLGVSTSSTSSALQNANKVLGMAAGESTRMTRELLALAGSGLTASQAIEGFNSALPVLARYGKQAVAEFALLAKSSRALGIDISALLSTMGQFDTFEGAATAAGKLNAILGGDLINSMDMMTASEGERVRMMIKGIEQSGKSWDSMNKFEKMALANAAGISDLAEASKLFGQSLSAYDSAVSKQNALAGSQEELEKRAKAALSVKEKMVAVMESFAIAVGPLVTALNWMIDLYLDLNDIIRKSTDGLIGLGGILAIVAGGYTLISKWLKIKSFLTAADTKLTLSQAGAALKAAFAKKAQAGAQEGLNNSMDKQGPAAAKSVGPLLAMGAAVMMIGAGIGLAAWGISSMIASLEGLSTGALITAGIITSVLILAFVGLAIAIVTLGAASAVSFKFVLALGAGILMIGAGIALAAVGMGFLVRSLASLVDSATSLVEVLTPVKIFAISTALLSLAAVSYPLIGAAFGFGIFATSLGIMAGALSIIDVSSLVELNKLLMNIQGLDAEKTVQFKAVMQDMSDMFKSADSATSRSRTSRVEKINQAFAASSGSSGGSGHPTIEIPISFNIDGDTFEKKVVRVVNGRVNILGAG